MRIKRITIPTIGVDLKDLSDGINIIFGENADYIAALAGAVTAHGWCCLPDRDVVPITLEIEDEGKQLTVSGVPGSTSKSILRVDKVDCFNLLRMGKSHVFSNDGHAPSEIMLSDNENSKYNYEQLLEQTRLTTMRGDVRPIFLMNFFERLDESEDFSYFVQMLSAFHRQLFIAIRCPDEQKEFYRSKLRLETFEEPKLLCT
jgi:hypothetical protein